MPAENKMWSLKERVVILSGRSQTIHTCLFRLNGKQRPTPCSLFLYIYLLPIFLCSPYLTGRRFTSARSSSPIERTNRFVSVWCLFGGKRLNGVGMPWWFLAWNGVHADTLEALCSLLFLSPTTYSMSTWCTGGLCTALLPFRTSVMVSFFGLFIKVYLLIKSLERWFCYLVTVDFRRIDRQKPTCFELGVLVEAMLGCGPGPA